MLGIITLRDTSGQSGICGSDVEVRRVQARSVRTRLGFNFEGVAPAPYAVPNYAERRDESSGSVREGPSLGRQVRH